MFLFLEPFYGGSHKNFADGLIAHSRHVIDLHFLPARFWKWRMRGAALYFLHQIADPASCEGIITSDLMSASDFKAIAGPDCPPILVYFHENQLTYPLSAGETMDYQFGFTDITTALAADRLLFNSKAHLQMFLDAMPEFLNRMPDFRPKWAIEAIEEKAGICYPGCAFPADCGDTGETAGGPPIVVWNHRWEHDKDPETFFSVMEQVRQRGIDFRIAVLGEVFARRPRAFDRALEQLGDRIVQFGYAAGRRQYFEWLKAASVVVSTARQENFGLSIVEAVRCGCLPLLPDRLSYPELIAPKYHDTCLYRRPEELTDKLTAVLSDPAAFKRQRLALASAMEEFAWPRRVRAFDDHLAALAGSPIIDP
ncbi:MAG: tRNA-queuosine alpha-mannosyltransferase domain-containing protein [Thermodesulfobacteriota bacterium]